MRKKRAKYLLGCGLRRMARKSISWMKSRVRPPLAARTALVSRPQTLDVTVVADPQQRSARHVADAGRLDDDRAGPAARETLVPGDDGVVDEAVLGRAPGHHRGNPGPLRQDTIADRYRRKQPGSRGFARAGNAAPARRIANALRGTPHGLECLSRSGRRPSLRGARRESNPGVFQPNPGGARRIAAAISVLSWSARSAARPCTRSCGFEASQTIPFPGADQSFQTVAAPFPGDWANRLGSYAIGAVSGSRPRRSGRRSEDRALRHDGEDFRVF